MSVRKSYNWVREGLFEISHETEIIRYREIRIMIDGKVRKRELRFE